MNPDITSSNFLSSFGVKVASNIFKSAIGTNETTVLPDKFLTSSFDGLNSAISSKDFNSSQK